MKLAIGSDHGGFELKESIKEYLDSRGVEYKDFGCYDTKSVSYATYAEVVARAVVAKECDLGILVCGTGVGISMAANKVYGVRAACCSDCFSARMTRFHNDANILCLGGRVVGGGLANDMVELFVTTEYEGGRHQSRIDMITAIEDKERAQK